MITPIQCATMHSGLTEQEVKEKYGWVLRALNEYGSRCAYDFLEGNSPEPAKHKPFIVGNVRDILDELNQGEITFFLFVEKLNAIASKFYEKPSEGASEGISKIREVMNWISQCVDEDHDLEVSEIKMIWNDLSDAISLIESTPHSSEGMAEALAKFFAKECKVGDPLLSIIDSIYDDWKLVYDKLRIETSFSEAAIQANKFVIEKYASLSSPGSGWVSVEDAKPNGRLCAVLVCNNWAPEHKRCTRTAIWFGQTNKFFMDCDNAFTAHEISHWQPLPAPPGVEDNQTKKQ